MTPLAEVEEVLSGARRWCVIHADNRDVLPLLPDKSVAHVITDPPYSEHVHSKNRRGASLPDGEGKKWHGESRGGLACISRARELGFDSISLAEMEFCADRFADLARRWVIVFCDDELASAWQSELVVAGLQHIRIGHWIKLGATPQFTGDRPACGAESIEIAHPPGRKKWNGGGTHAVWAHPIALERGDGTIRVHTTQKPESLMVELVELFTDPDEVVLDPFAGSGTTGVACLRTGRRFIGIEKDARYAEIARERMEAESRGLTLRAARAGQIPLFGGSNV